MDTPELPSVSAVNGPISHMIARATKAHIGAAAGLLRKAGLTAGPELLLMVLWDRDGRSQAELGKALGLDPSTITAKVKTLERDGLIVRTPDPADRRAMVVSLTEKGAALRPEVERIWAELEAVTTRGFSDRQRAEFLRMLRRVEANLLAPQEQ
ncbi:MarR family winged helix-turn-helix transcriptional regulator [Nocardia sp. NPDC052566]|uniref:MarR family winged helix-turn-helix transcriptional regulator n=1 Tax=Nocardia sp. NPDC052566 TaxID=3364330 RepID=UPI0037C992F9